MFFHCGSLMHETKLIVKHHSERDGVRCKIVNGGDLLPTSRYFLSLHCHFCKHQEEFSFQVTSLFIFRKMSLFNYFPG